MTIAIEQHEWGLSRPCSFSLCFQGGSVYADFDIDPDGRVYLVRISFDGYGCCSVPDGDSPRMSQSDSRALLGRLGTNSLDTDPVRKLVRTYFGRVKGVVWPDALAEHGLLDA